MSIRGLYSWDDTIFESMQVPAAFTEDDKENLIDNILIETTDFECVYSSPEFLAVAIDRWSRKELPTWERIYRVSTMNYNPLENYNRVETSTETTENTQQHSGTDASAHTGTDTETHSGTDTETHSGTDTETHSGTDTETHSGTDTETNSGTDQVTSNSTTALDGTDTETHSGTDTTTVKKAAFDTNTLVDTESTATINGHTITKDMDDKTTVTGTGSTTYGHKVDTKHGEAIATQHGQAIATQHGQSIATQHGQAIATQHGETITDTYGHKVDDSGEVTRESHISGNIGVTTSQQMAEAEILVSAKLNVYNYIIESFKNRFCLLVY